MSISGFFAAARGLLKPKPVTQHDMALKAMTCVAEGAHRRATQRRPKRNIHIGAVEQIGEVVHRLPGGKTKRVPIFYQIMTDGSRYPFAHSYGGRHPGWLTRGLN